ncbi:hypothetical protein DFQ28_005438 [Apophysomyces sp. BC1034]|nr:hypothetical protein DFQ30_010794 [Apophysomyces sp. BC1015]KAG0181087.1 hypothetical protein DFQ29_009402 [Apophysomyces sp. BC1021]KAG0188074.1 hypothetical protein DFQ28_005438 [Apophysomyces sp. BC1034]
MSSTRDAEKKVSEKIEKASQAAQDEVAHLRAELDDLRRKAGPKMREAENYLTSPTALGFYQGVVVGAALVLAYAKVQGGLRI